MKKLVMIYLAILLALLPVFALAADSKGNTDIPQTKIVDVVPEDATEEVIIPKVEIVTDTEKVIELQEQMKTVFTLTIYYVYADGSKAADTYSAVLQAGSEFSVESPAIDGYVASLSAVSGNMPMRDIQFTVVYLSPDEESPIFPFSQMLKLFNLNDYETPLGLGFSVSNVGICFE